MSSLLQSVRSSLLSSHAAGPLMEPLAPFPGFPTYAIKTFPQAVAPLWSKMTSVQSATDALKHFYLHAQPIHSAFLFCTYNMLWTWIAGEITGNYSQVDRVWTFLPVIYTAHFTLQPLIAIWSLLPQAQRPDSLASLGQFVANHIDRRQALALATQLVWSFRLTLNAARRGFFDPRSEDYRWPYAKKFVPAWVWSIFNLTFIAIVQNMLLLLIAIPSHYLLIQAQPQTYHSPALPEKVSHALMTYPYLTTSDWVLAGLAVSCVTGQWVSDGIQQAYQSWKHLPDSKRPKTKTWSMFPFGLGPKIKWGEDDRKRGFVTQGTWSISRHPAFALEQTFWFIQALFPVVPLLYGVPSAIVKTYQSTGSIQRTAELFVKDVLLVDSFPTWAFASPIALGALFLGSTFLTEWISSPKYPLYSSEYKKRVGMFWPIQTYLKRVWLSVTIGNERRKTGERRLGWGNRKKLD